MKTKWVQMILTIYPTAYELYWAFPNIMLCKKFKLFPSNRTAILTLKNNRFELTEHVKGINWGFRFRKFNEGLYRQVAYYHSLFLKFTDNLGFSILEHRRTHEDFRKSDIMEVKKSKLPIKQLSLALEKPHESHSKNSAGPNFSFAPERVTTADFGQSPQDRVSQISINDTPLGSQDYTKISHGTQNTSEMSSIFSLGVGERLSSLVKQKIEEKEFWNKMHHKEKRDIDEKLVLTRLVEIAEKVKFMLIYARKSRMVMAEIISKLRAGDYFWDYQFYEKC